MSRSSMTSSLSVRWPASYSDVTERNRNPMPAVLRAIARFPIGLRPHTRPTSPRCCLRTEPPPSSAHSCSVCSASALSHTCACHCSSVLILRFYLSHYRRSALLLPSQIIPFLPARCGGLRHAVHHSPFTPRSWLTLRQHVLCATCKRIIREGRLVGHALCGLCCC